MRLTTLAGAFAAGMFLCGCAFTPHDIALNPQVAIAPSTIGQGQRINFRFADERDDVKIGLRGTMSQGAEITAANLDRVTEAQLRQGLAKKGYQLLPADQSADGTVTFRLRALKFGIETGFWAGSDVASAVLAVDAMKGGRSFTNVYRYNSSSSAMVIPAGDEIDVYMNTALSNVLQQALTDPSLDQFLTSKNAPVADVNSAPSPHG